MEITIPSPRPPTMRMYAYAYVCPVTLHLQYPVSPTSPIHTYIHIKYVDILYPTILPAKQEKGNLPTYLLGQAGWSAVRSGGRKEGQGRGNNGREA